MALIPEVREDIVNEISEEVNPTYTWKISIDNEDGMIGSIAGYTENREAIKQQLYLLLNTQYGKYKIYEGTPYGVEKDDLIGMPIPYVVPEIERRYIDAIKRNIPEVESVGSFSFSMAENRKDVLIVSFKVSTIYGEYTVENGVAV